MSTTKERVIELFKEFYEKNKRTPTKDDFSGGKQEVSHGTIRRLFGTWNNAIVESGLVPNIVMGNSFFANCKTCDKQVRRTDKDRNENNNYFCSHTCSAKYTNLHRAPASEEENQRRSIGLKKYYENNKKPDVINTTNCVICNTVIEYFNKNKKDYCSRKCIGIHAARVRPKESVKRSKNEIYFSELCEDYFGKENVTTNEKFFDGWDADVILHGKKIAVLWNGIWHYQKVVEKHSVCQVQSRDEIKLKIIEKYGYVAYTIKDMGKANKGFVEQEFEIFRLMCIDCS